MITWKNIHTLATVTVTQPYSYSDSDNSGIVLRLHIISELIKFDGASNGSPGSYETFCETFQSTVANSDFSDLTKFILLKSKLGGNALLTVDNLKMKEGSYLDAWPILDKHFYNERRIIATNLESLLNLPPLISDNRTSLVEFIGAYKCSVHNMRNILKPFHASYFLVYLIIRQLDHITRVRFEDYLQRKDSKDLPTMTELDDFMHI